LRPAGQLSGRLGDVGEIRSPGRDHPRIEALEQRVLLDADEGLVVAIGLPAADQAEIRGQTWHDLNADGLHDPGEIGLDGWTVELIDAATGHVLASTQTGDVDLDSDGATDPRTEAGWYAFTGLARGVYGVREVPQVGWGQLCPDACGQTIAVGPGEVAGGADFGNCRLVEVTGQLFEDFDANGAFGCAERGLAGWTVELVDRVHGQVVARATTFDDDVNGDGGIDPHAETGLYRFTDIRAGVYELCAPLPPDWHRTLPASMAYELELASAGTGYVYLFGQYPCCPLPVPMQPVAPLGSLSHRTSATRTAAGAAQMDRFTTALQAGQTATLLIEPQSATLDVAASLLAPSGTLIAQSSEGAAGVAEFLQLVELPETGTYRIEVTCQAGEGDYRVSLLLNAAAEEELLPGRVVNDAIQLAESADGSFLGLGGSAARGAVCGNLDPIDLDWYALTLEAGEAVTVALTSQSGRWASSCTAPTARCRRP
jgi:hypothetical protein